MAAIPKILERQKVIGDEIVCIHTKLDDRPIRLPKLNDFKKRVLKFKDEFRANNETLSKYGNKSEDYFTQGYFDYITTIIKEIDEIIINEESRTEKATEISSINKDTKIMEVPYVTEYAQKHTINEEFSKMANSLKELCDELITNIETLSITSLPIKQKQLESRYQRMLNKFEKVPEAMNIDELLTETEDYYYKALIIINNKKGDAESTPKSASNIDFSSSANLSKIKIPEFEGNINDWASFYDLFKSLVHDCHQLSDVEKMYRLTTSLKGEAKKLIQHLNITSNNYEAALEILKQRYENRRLLFTNQVDILLDQPIVDSESSDSLKQLLDTTNSCIYILKGMNLKLEDAEPFIARIIIRKLDKNGLRRYEQNIKKSKEIQSLEDVMDFLEQEVQALEAVSKGKLQNNFKRKTSEMSKSSNSFHSIQKSCLHCNLNNHSTPECRKFLALSTAERRKLAYNNRWCFTCIEHKSNKWCSSKIKCCHCGKGHHKILHLIEENKDKSQTSSMTTKGSTTTSVLLATAQVKVQAANGEQLMLRALIDQGSQITTLSEEASQLLRLPKTRCKTEIHGLGGAVVGVSSAKTKLVLRPRFLSNNLVETEALILPRLTGAQPSQSFENDIEEWKNFILADPSFNESDRIDIVIGGDIIPHIIKEGVHKKRGVLAQSTIFGWILSGVINKKTKPEKVVSATTTNLERFWEIEETSLEFNNHEEDEFCQELFKTSTKIDDSNRIVVNLPIKKDNNELGESKKQAVARLLSMEKKFNSNPKLNEQYIQFMEEYERLGHMKLTTNNSGKYYLPHQAVIRENSLTTKLRVVFDASAKTTNGKSLNDVMYTGPRLQKDIFDIILKWRLWRYVMMADVEKMYRQVRVAEEDQKYQHILWRKNNNELIKEYKLTTITYGTASAPFLAVRALFYIADTCPIPEIKNIIKEDFYMDDLITGADTIKQCKYIQHSVLNHLASYGFKLRKWLSNEKQITEDVCSSIMIQIKDDESIKTLGLQWDPVLDNFKFGINFSNNDKITKRHVLSEVAKIFDPLGWLSPVTVLAKLFIQKLWLLQNKWDEVIPDELNNEWQVFKNNISSLQEIRVPRWVQLTTKSRFELHGFADASEKAYAAVIYIKKENSVTLLTAKTKVNPIKNRKTLPKLELCAAHLLAKLLQKVSNIVKGQHTIYAWSDSTITLAWVKNKTNKDKFVRNRVAEINNIIPNAIWNHVSSKDNPADIASRGICASQFKAHSLWWNGPQWLNKSSEYWPCKAENSEIVVTAVTRIRSSTLLMEVINKYSNYTRLQRVVAYILRFINKLKKKPHESQHLSVGELKAADKIIVRYHQENEFNSEISDLKRNGVVNKCSKIANLFPFIDNDCLLRVGGRLQNSNLPYNQQHPVILMKSSLASAIVKKVHIQTLHGGNRIVEATLRRNYWIIDMKNIIKKFIRSCPTCIRYSQEKSKQLMGNLPEARVTISAPFKHVGIDYAGPIQMKYSKGRGQRSYKGYIAVFVCMTTKAIHLEAVSDLTSDAFLAALKRFFSRRGVSSDIYSDNGTNFIGANRKLDKDFKSAVLNNKTVIPILASQKIRWHFIPPAAPHFGGIWEAGVKSVKFHLKRTIGETKLTYEEMSTLLAQIEAVLNSRPLVELRDDEVDRIDVLTPAHFLIGRPLNDCPEHIEECNISSLNRWKLIQKIRKDFWNRWRDEYLTTLQQRNKWKFSEENLKEGAVVIVKDDNTHPASWPLAKVIEAHSGKDGKVRVVSLKLQNNILKRPINKLCPLMSTYEEKEKLPPVRSCFMKAEKTKKEEVCWIRLLLVLMVLINPVKSQPISGKDAVSIKELSPHTAIYLDKVGQINSINSKWNLVVYYNLSLHYEEITKIGIIIKKVKDECPKLEIYKESCEMVMTAMERRYNILTQNNELLINKQRIKRSPFEFVGSIYNILFGMMDAEDREEMERNMRSIFSNQQDLNKLMKEQTSIVDSTINVLKKTTEDVKKSFKQMHSQLKLFCEEVNNELITHRLTVFFNVMTTQLNLMIDECFNIQSSIINLLIDVNHGHINTDLLTPSQLQKELMDIEKILPNNLMLPGKATGTELKEVYHELKAKGTIIDSRLVVQVEIPLIQTHSSEVYEIIMLPVDNEVTAVMAIVQDDFIVYNFATNMYYLMSQSQLNKCEKNLQGQYNCLGNMPWKPAIERACEVSALKQSRHADCSFKAVPRKSVWKQLSSENHWIFTVFDNLILTVDCGLSNRSWITLPLKGILQLPYGCTAAYEGITLTASKQFTSEKKTTIQSSSWELDYKKINSKLVKPFDVTIINNTKYIEKLQKDVEIMKAKNIELRELNFHTAPGHASFIIILISIIVLIFVYIKYKCCNKNAVVKLDFSPPVSYSARQNVQTN